MLEKKNYDWKYASIGGVTRVKIDSGEAIAHLGELDQKKWTVLSCPTEGLGIDPATLKMIDTDGDGKIRVDEIVAAAQWLTAAVKDKELLLKGDSSIALEQIADEQLRKSAVQIMKNLGIKKNVISIAESSDSKAIFAGTKFNGDGIITPASTDTPALAKTIESCIATMGGVEDRSGDQGVNAELIEKFYATLADYSAWQAAAEADKANVFPYGDNTEAALAACEALKDKIADYYMRCKLIRFDSSVSGAVDVSADKVAAISDKNLSTCAEEIATYPLARPSAGNTLPFNAVNPAWQGAFNALKSLVLDTDLAGKDEMTEEEWNSILAKFGAYTAWKGAKKGAEVESLGLAYVNELLEDNKKAILLGLIDKDKALEAESASIDAVDKFMHLYRDFYRLLNNYVTFTEFYGRGNGVNAVFEAGQLFIDERCCNLCINVKDMGAHADMASLSGMFLIYCSCTSKKLGKTMNIAAVMTAGSIKNLRPGKNAIFYDLNGESWDAVVTKIVDNPISVKQAFWSPYRKLAKFINDKIDKSAAEKDSAATADLLAKADGAEPGKKQPFDIAKFAGIFAAVGMAFAGIGVALKALISGIAALKWWQFLLVIAAIMLVISGPACFIAWKKLRKRDLGPVLNANGWAINSNVLVNILFGGTLTSVAKFPIVKGDDPFKKKTPAWRKALRCIIAALVIAFGILFLTDNLKFIGIQRHKEAAEEPVAEAVAENAEGTETAAPAEAAADAPAEAETPAATE